MSRELHEIDLPLRALAARGEWFGVIAFSLKYRARIFYLSKIPRKEPTPGNAKFAVRASMPFRVNNAGVFVPHQLRSDYGVNTDL